jgi:hypothetical protein
MKKIIIGSAIALTTTMVVNATVIEAGWNLLGAGSSDVNLSTTYGDNSDIKVIWGFENDTKTWKGYSPDSAISQTLTTSGLGGLQSIHAGMGYWVLSNSSTTTTIPADDNVSTDLNMTTNTAATLSFASSIGGISTDEHGKWYGVISIAGTVFSENGYDYNGTDFEPSETHAATFTYNSDYNGSIYVASEGFGADIVIKKTEQITDIAGMSYSDLYVSDIEFHVTAAGSGWSDVWDWAPHYWDDANHVEVNVTTNDQLLELFLTQNNWFSDNYAMLDGDSSAVQGNVVEGRFVSNCDSNNDGIIDMDCVIAERTSTVIGSWTYSTNGISIDLPNETKVLSMIADANSQTGYSIQSNGTDKVGAIWYEKIYTGMDVTASLVESILIH